MARQAGKEALLGDRLIIPLAVVGLLAIVAVHIAVLVLGVRADAISRTTETDLIGNGLAGKGAMLVTGRVALLGEADLKQPPQPEPRDRTLSLDAAGQVQAFVRGDAAAPVSREAFLAAAGPALTRLATAPTNPDTGRPQATHVGWLAGQPELFLAVRRPDRSVVLTSANINDFAAEYAERRNIAYSLVALDKADPRMLVAPLQFGDETPSLGLQWAPRSLANEIIGPLVPLLWSLTILALGGGFWLVQRARRLARSLVASEAHAQHLALHDVMTGLANRALFGDRLDHALELRRRSGGLLAVVCIDLDRFKQTNDTLGHQAGDEMIREAGRRILAVSRASDTVARLGGDEFALVLAPVADRNAVEMVCARLNEALCGKLNLPSGQAFLSASIGVTLVHDDLTTGADAIRQADLALYAAKHGGRGRFVVFSPEMDESLQLRHTIETDLRAAIESGGLDVNYQPQVSLRGRFDGVEALVRWTHPVRGPISPAYFIPIAEEAGLIHDLGRFVMSEAFRNARRWPGLRIAVNVSPLQLRDPGFVELCRDLLAEAGVRPSQIEFEITEGVLIDNDEVTQAVLKQLRELGVKLALDDFGTGYSSLSYLNAYPIDKIKIDRSFVSNLGLESDADKVIRAIIKLGRAMGLKVTAEGVETAQQHQRLVSAGCSSFQGYLHGRPVAAGEIDALLRAEQAVA